MFGKLKIALKRSKIFIDDPEKKPYFKIFFESIHFGIIKREFPYFYFGKFLYRSNVINYLDYLSSKQVDAITLSKKLHNSNYSALLRNKLAFSFIMERYNFPSPKLLGYNFGKRFSALNRQLEIMTEQELISFFGILFNKHKVDKIFAKPLSEMGGKGCMLLSQDIIEDNSKEILDALSKDDYLYQSLIEQHPVINAIYKESVNSIRFDTYVDRKNDIHILSAFMRFGSGGGFVDNSSSGGMYVPVDMKNGCLKGDGLKLMRYGGGSFKYHPDSNLMFDQFKIPYFQESCELVKRLVEAIPDRMIGWDIAISKDGPVVIEGNDNNSMIGPDITYGGYLSHPVFKEIMKEI